MKGFLAVAGNPKSYGKTYSFSGGEAIAIRDMAKLMLKHIGQKKLFITIPIPDLQNRCVLVGAVSEKTVPNVECHSGRGAGCQP
jgi:nucleoside-diphosphate-sugar epimerase